MLRERVRRNTDSSAEKRRIGGVRCEEQSNTNSIGRCAQTREASMNSVFQIYSVKRWQFFFRINFPTILFGFGPHLSINKTYRFSHSICVVAMNGVDAIGSITVYGKASVRTWEQWHCGLCVGIWHLCKANRKSDFFQIGAYVASMVIMSLLVVSAASNISITDPIPSQTSWIMRQMHRHRLEIILLIDFLLMTHIARQKADDRISK